MSRYFKISSVVEIVHHLEEFQDRGSHAASHRSRLSRTFAELRYC